MVLQHGLMSAFWGKSKCFNKQHNLINVIFSQQTWLSTAPNAPLTHWYQVRCPIMNPLLVRVGDKVHVKLKMIANERQSYDITMSITMNGVSQFAEYDLKNPSFRYNGGVVQPAAGLSNECASQQCESFKFFSIVVF